jgi:C-terminal processing protease CtpA/Prc
MTRSRIRFFVAAGMILTGQLSLRAQTNSSPLDFQEVYDLIHQHAAGVSEAELNRAAVKGLVAALGPKVSLVTKDSGMNAEAETNLLTQSTMFDGNIAYLRIARVDDGLAKAVGAAYQQLNATNKVNGIVLDLRYADGSDYKAAAATAELFIGKNEPLLNWGEGIVSSHEKTNALTMPVGVLVNHETAGAPEALAAVLRETGSGLILGSPTAGAAMVMQDYPLKNGDHLRIASSPVTLGDGSALSTHGIKPDIDVTVSVEAERAFYADAFLVVSNRVASLSATNQLNGTNPATPHVRFNEAELVREHKAGENPDEEVAKRPPEAQVPVVSDPALARALDLLKGLAVVRQNNS